jgi:hypothetical protein
LGGGRRRGCGGRRCRALVDRRVSSGSRGGSELAVPEAVAGDTAQPVAVDGEVEWGVVAHGVEKAAMCAGGAGGMASPSPDTSRPGALGSECARRAARRLAPDLGSSMRAKKAGAAMGWP